LAAAIISPPMPITNLLTALPQITDITQTVIWNPPAPTQNPASAPTGYLLCAGTNEGQWLWSTNLPAIFGATSFTGTISFRTTDDWYYLYFSVFAVNAWGKSPPGNVGRIPDWDPNAIAIRSRAGAVPLFSSEAIAGPWSASGMTPQTNSVAYGANQYWKGDGLIIEPLRLWNAAANHFGR
jgi:hypothetical protein